MRSAHGHWRIPGPTIYHSYRLSFWYVFSFLSQLDTLQHVFKVTNSFLLSGPSSATLKISVKPTLSLGIVTAALLGEVILYFELKRTELQELFRIYQKLQEDNDALRTTNVFSKEARSRRCVVFPFHR